MTPARWYWSRINSLIDGEVVPLGLSINTEENPGGLWIESADGKIREFNKDASLMPLLTHADEKFKRHVSYSMATYWDGEEGDV